MRNAQYQLFYKEKATRGPVLQLTYDGEKQLDVLEITTRDVVHLRARDISIYRHSLLIDSKHYDILNVFKLQ